MTVFELNPLPDFLNDHSLAGTGERNRLEEHCRKWAQFVSSLWVWKGKAGFGIRFISEGGSTRCFFICAARQSQEENALATSVEALMLGAGLLRATDPYIVTEVDFIRLSELTNPIILDRAQMTVSGLWTLPRSYQREASLGGLEGKDIPVVFPWNGPSGPSSAAMGLLISHGVKAVISVCISPEEFPLREIAMLTVLASAARSEASQTDGIVGSGPRARVNAGAEIAGAAHASHLGRLTSGAFLTLLQVAVENGRRDVAESLIAALQGGVLGQPESAERGKPSYPAGLSPCVDLTDGGNHPHNSLIYESLDLTVLDSAELPQRLQLLNDAVGAATVFRFPVSIQSGLPGITVRQFPPDHHHGPVRRTVPAGEKSIHLGEFSGGGMAAVPINHLTRHALIVGFTGAGKTVTALHLLHQLAVDHHIPWLVLESSKQEYRGLTTVRALRESGRCIRVYTLGNDTCLPFRLNPFQLMNGMRVEAHISRLQVCFEASVPLIGPAASVLHEGLCRVYAESGWKLSDVSTREARRAHRFPVMRDFLDVIKQVIKDRGYQGETKSNVEAAVVGRFQPLVSGSKGLMFDTPECDPPVEVLFGENVILEMNDLNIDDKALTVMFILTMLREYRDLNDNGSSALKHVTLIEEAHNVMAATTPGETESKADTRGKAVESLCNMLAEIRSFGEGVIIADQSPQKLARDALRNTNLQISHQLRDGIDRDTMASAMIMDDEQKLFLGKLEVGSAGVFWTGREKAGFLRVPVYNGGKESPGYGFSTRLRDDDLQSIQQKWYGKQGFTAWTDWYLMISRENRRRSGWTLADLWKRAAELTLTTIDPENKGVRFEDAWSAFSSHWQRLCRLARQRPERSVLTDEHKRLFMKGVEASL